MFKSLLSKTPCSSSSLLLRKSISTTTQKISICQPHLLVSFKLNHNLTCFQHNNLSLLSSLTLTHYRTFSNITLPSNESPKDSVNVSFYMFSDIPNPSHLRDSLLSFWARQGIKGRCYIAKEGINSQITVPIDKKDVVFSEELRSEFPFLNSIYLNYSHDTSPGFQHLKVMVKNQVLADGNVEVNLENTGEYVSPSEWDKLLSEMKSESKKYLLLDVRNNYESEIGYFEDGGISAIRPNVDTFKSSIPVIKEILKGKEDHTILMYCTGGIRCTKMSSILKDSGFEDVKQLKGGIVTYLREIKKTSSPSKFKGKNFVFDERLIEEGSVDIVGKCHHCGDPWDEPTNCFSRSCNAIIVMCPNCRSKLHGTCGQHLCMDSVTNDKKPNVEQNNSSEASKDFSRRPHIKSEGLTLDEVKYPYLNNNT
eukprot:TRINITY_DN5673_c0_g1_i1.p1 TRINITY_DN5673_c0_g1~~TRINITY_DN5673_c0_g1_i1.p1  ORF type:complete len:462 (+),score=83.66 TRINITY_DN5673_c0_g1_i1:120-1388(+)